ncbi:MULTISPECIES: low temperature requirement protein A [unclassified Rhodococcus (in: high G+C Gram-positive bacteria)]|uniref:low temperature requirement protein A n=1 Tax=unclassified Rhodococcus (in: high G+C Gram-positive bacteria) TaxID=192944 RepID=UPI00163A2059|nr:MULTISPECIES: low temperature requirement protein A [unclassified Rhodococcus (in: high G+C Gram-positive bacteria)]MBC2637938.1 low temperature requirement protein A [Rhodococcus sp. 3A]MBC2897315.1 low temperature requirement protein A [Rhodococcus sp. 4CII]
MTVDDGNAAGGSTGREPDTDGSQESNGRSVGNLELFFDLTFVYAMSQVTHLMLSDISWQGFGRGVLALLALWWAWVCYAWLTNTFETARVMQTTLIIVAMAAMLIAAIALPTAFTTGALVFGLALLAVRVINVGMFLASSSRDEAELATAIRRLVPGLLVGPALIVAAAFVASPYRELLWVAAAAVDFGGPLVAGISGLRVVPSYFIERHGSVIIIALGETIISLGAGATENLRHPGVLGAVVLGVLISATLWWTYFGLTAGAEERMQRTRSVDRARLARDAYSYLHLPLVAGIVFFALGARVSVEHIDEPLAPLAALALTGGVALFYAAEVAYRWRDHHQLTVDRLLTAAAALLVFPLAISVPAVLSLTVLTAIGVLRLAWELWRRPQIGTGIAGAVW